MEHIGSDIRNIYEGPANLYRGIEGVGGKLVLSEDRLIFTPHNLNIQKEQEIICLNEIVSIDKAKSLGIFPNSILIKTSASKFKFVVKKRKEWVQRILDALGEI
jgi:hypothetical protein